MPKVKVGKTPSNKKRRLKTALSVNLYQNRSHPLTIEFNCVPE
jgi:hypothetical protein